MKRKVLHIIGGMGRGGAPIFIINNLKYVDGTKLQFDFLCRKDNCAYDDIIKQHGGNIYIVPDFPRHLFSNFTQTLRFFREHASEYEALHVHANALFYILPLILGKIYGVKKIILHSHNTQSNVGVLQSLHYINRLFVNVLSNVHLACGQEAGKWMFSNRPFEVINNAIDVEMFKYSEQSREAIRRELGIPKDAYLIGNVGRFETAKNHTFIIDVFKNVHDIKPSSVLLLVGEGSLFEEIKEKVKLLSLTEFVYFLGLRSDIERIYSAMDLFFLPSLFEGLPFVLIEAQCSGVNCLVSDTVTKEAFITDLVTSMKLEDDIKEWVSAIDHLSTVHKDRSQYAEVIHQKYYDIRYTAARLTEIYTKSLEL